MQSTKKLFALTTKNLVISDEKSYVNINQLSNVSASDATEGKFLTYDGTNWIPSELQVNAGIGAQTYSSLRYHSDALFYGNDTIILNLPLSSAYGPSFPVESIGYITYNLLVQETSESNWRNDLASVEFVVTGTGTPYVAAVINAPFVPYAYTFNATNNNPIDVPSDVSIANYTNVYVSNDAEILNNLNIKGTNELSNIGNNLLVDDMYNVADVFSAVDTRFAQLVTNFNNLREVQIGNFDIYGNKTVILNNFSSSDVDYLSLDVMVKYSGSTQYINDLISVRMSGTLDNQVAVEINAPSVSSEDFYRIIAVKESGSI